MLIYKEPSAELYLKLVALDLPITHIVETRESKHLVITWKFRIGIYRVCITKDNAIIAADFNGKQWDHIDQVVDYLRAAAAVKA